MSETEIKKKSAFRLFIENYWYHYKWHTIITLFVVAVLAVGIFQMVAKDDTDIGVIYAGPQILSDRDLTEMEKAFNDIVHSDFTDDGKIVSNILNVVIMSDEQIEDAKEQAALESSVLFYSEQYRKEAKEQLNIQMMSGDSVICLFDRYAFDHVGKEAFLTLESVLGYKPDYAQDEYTVFLKDTEFAKHYKIFELLPPDTLLCIRKKTVISSFNGKKNEEQRHEYHKTVFKSLFEFDAAVSD